MAQDGLRRAPVSKEVTKFCAIIALLMAVCALSTGVSAKIHRDHAPLRAFVNQQACPATGLHRLPCPGWQIDHIEPLCAGGADAVENLQWLTTQEHKWKTRTDVRVCRSLK